MNSAKNHWLMIVGLFLAILVNPLTMSGLGANQCPITLVGHGHHGHHGDHHGGGWGHDHGDSGHHGDGHNFGHGGDGHHR